MLEVLEYRNHLGEIIFFGKEGIYANENDLRNFAWSYNSKNNRLSSFRRGVTKKNLDVWIVCTSEEEGIKKRNALFEICEKDVLAEEYGRIFIGGYYMKCYVIGSKKSEYLIDKKLMKVQLNIVTDTPAWFRESTNVFRRISNPLSPAAGGQDLDYLFDYAFDYASDVEFQTLANGDFTASDFRMIIYGPCVSPQIYISGHTYNVATEIGSNEYMLIDSIEKTITLVRTNGKKVNCFNDRNRESYVFEKIPAGANSVTWEGDFGFDITLLEERSEPKWT